MSGAAGRSTRPPCVSTMWTDTLPSGSRRYQSHAQQLRGCGLLWVGMMRTWCIASCSSDRDARRPECSAPDTDHQVDRAREELPEDGNAPRDLRSRVSGGRPAPPPLYGYSGAAGLRRPPRPPRATGGEVRPVERSDEQPLESAGALHPQALQIGMTISQPRQRGRRVQREGRARRE
jgi:hypothetical protein